MGSQVLKLPGRAFVLLLVFAVTLFFGIGTAATAKAQPAHAASMVTLKFDPNGGKLAKKQRTKKVAANHEIGKMPTPKRKGYHFMGWYQYQKYEGASSYTLSNGKTKSNAWTKSTDKKLQFKARWVKKGKGATITKTEWKRVKANLKYGLEYKDACAIIGGKGSYVGYYFGQLYNSAHQWNGPSSYKKKGPSKVTIAFWGGTGSVSRYEACTPFTV